MVPRTDQDVEYNRSATSCNVHIANDPERVFREESEALHANLQQPLQPGGSLLVGFLRAWSSIIIEIILGDHELFDAVAKLPIVLA